MSLVSKSLICRFYGTTVGKKIVMAVSGLIMVGFVIGHMLGNLKFFFPTNPKTGQYAIDHYAEFLRSIGEDLVGHGNFLWIVRAILLVAIVAHFVSAFQLSRLNRKAKPIDYAIKKHSSSNAASRTMMYGGIFLLVFIILHILHFTTGTVHYQGFVEGHVYSNIYNGFSVWYVTLFYVLAMVALCMHLFHGTWSMFQTLGVDNPKWNGGLRTLAKIVAVALFFGFCALPISSFFGLVQPPHSAAEPHNL